MLRHGISLTAPAHFYINHQMGSVNPKRISTHLLFNRRVIAVLFLSFSSTLPLVLIATTLQAWYTAAGMGLMMVGSLSLVQYPYLAKFLWAPLMDRYMPVALGRRRAWILLTQLGLFITLSILAFMEPRQQPWLIFSLAIVMAFISASQDIAIDGYRVDVLEKKERGVGAAVTMMGGRMAMLVGGGLTLILAAHYGWRFAYLFMAILMLIQIIPTLAAPHPDEPVTSPSPPTLRNAVVVPFRELFTRSHIMMILLLVLIYKFGDALALSLNTTFLMRGIGFTLSEIGWTYKTISIIASVSGGLLGGFLLPRLGMYRSLMIFGFLQTIATLSFLVLAWVGKSFPVMIGAIFTDYFFGGLSTVAFIAFLISLCKQEYSATQYAILSAVMAVARVCIGPVAGYLVKHQGWFVFYLLSFFAGFPALILLRWLRDRINFGVSSIQFSAEVENADQKRSTSSDVISD